MDAEHAFVDLRRLADWFATLAGSSTRSAIHVERIVERLGATCVPLLGRALCSPGVEHARTRDAARVALAYLATPTSPARARVIKELRRIAASDVADPNARFADEGKVCAVGLLAELGEHGSARFADPTGIQRRAAVALAAQLDTASEVAAAADMMVRQLDDDDIVRMLEVMTDAACAAAAHRLATELAMRLDASAAVRDRIRGLLATIAPPATPAGRLPRSPQVVVLVDAATRLVVIASRKIAGERRWRRWAVLIGATGHIDDCLHDDDAGDGEGGELVAGLVADGYRVASSDVERARAIVVAAVGVTGAELTSAYYLGRDLLELGDAHAGARKRTRPHVATTLGHAIDLLGDGDIPGCQALLARCEPSADVAAATAACVLAEGGARDALPHLARAIEAEPDWPLHHWNLAAACHREGDASGCYHALRRFVATSAAPTGLYADLDQPGRVAIAEQLIAELERTARLAGTSLARRRKRRTTRASRQR